MATRLRSFVAVRVFVQSLQVCVLTCGFVLAQTNAKLTRPPEDLADEEMGFTLGCLSSYPGVFELTDADGNIYRLVGQASLLKKYQGQEISVRGPKDYSTKPWPSLKVVSIAGVFKAPKPILSSEFLSSSKWHTAADQAYGVKFSYPSTFTEARAADADSHLQSNFAEVQPPEILASLKIPRETYADTNFVGGFYKIAVNPRIASRQKCDEFERFDMRYLSFRTVGGIKYTEMIETSVAAGTVYTDYYFHTFQNASCYELSFDVAEFNTASQDLGCRVPGVRQEDELNMMEALIARVHFSPHTRITDH